MKRSDRSRPKTYIRIDTYIVHPNCLLLVMTASWFRGKTSSTFSTPAATRTTVTNAIHLTGTRRLVKHGGRGKRQERRRNRKQTENCKLSAESCRTLNGMPLKSANRPYSRSAGWPPRRATNRLTTITSSTVPSFRKPYSPPSSFPLEAFDENSRRSLTLLSLGFYLCFFICEGDSFFFAALFVLSDRAIFLVNYSSSANVAPELEARAFEVIS